MRPRLFALMLAAGFPAAMLFAQPAMLSYRPVTAEFSSALNRMIMVSGNPNSLHIYDPVSGNNFAVSLVQPPLSLALSPDGKHAVVGHDALLSYVNLTTASVEKTIPVSVKAGSVVLSSSWIYVMPTYMGGSVSVNLATGAVIPNSNIHYGSNGKLNTAVNAIYGTRDGLSPNDIVEYDISTGPITRQFDSPYHGDYCIFGPVWFSPDGSRIYTGCGTVFHASKDPKRDMYYAGSLPGVTSVTALAESAEIGRVALIPKPTVYPADPNKDGVVMLFESAYFRPAGQFALPSFSVGGASFQAHGRWVFFNLASTELYVVMEADAGSGLLNPFAVLRIPLSAPAACGAAFASATADVAAAGAVGSVKIEAPAGCVYSVSSLSPWIQIVSGGYGSGNGALTYMVRTNPDPARRSGVLSMGGQTFSISQEGASGGDALTLLGYNAVDAAYAKALDRIVLVAANPDELHIYDPASRSGRAVALVSPPLSVSVRPDGRYAGVGHDGWVSYVNLQTATVERVYPVVTDVGRLVLAANGYMYLFPRRDWSDIYSLEVSTGTVTATSAIYKGRMPRLHASGKYLYVGGSWHSKWDISQGVAKLTDSIRNINACGNLWLTEDGRRAFTACATAYLTSEIPEQDAQYNGTLSMASSLVWADHSAERQGTAVIPAGNNSGYGPLRPGDTQVQIYGDAYLGYDGAIPLPQFTVGGSLFAGHGRFVFWNTTATALYVVMQANPASGLLSGTAVAQVLPSSALKLSVASVVNAASQTPGRIAPGEIVTIYGSGLGPATPAQFRVDPVTGMVSTTLADVRVYFGGVAAPILFASPNQVNAIVPYELGGGEVVVQASYKGVLSPATTLVPATSAPGIFTVDGSGSGQALAINQDGTICDSANPAVPGTYITVYFTGGGRTSPSGVTGSVNGTVLKRLAQTSTVTIGDQPATVTFAGAAPGMVDGVGQLNILTPADARSGSTQPLILTVGANSSPATATIAVR